MAGDFQLTASLSTTTTAASAVNLLRHAPGRGCSLPAVAAPSAIPTLDLHRILPPHRDTVHFIAYTFAPQTQPQQSSLPSNPNNHQP